MQRARNRRPGGPSMASSCLRQVTYRFPSNEIATGQGVTIDLTVLPTVSRQMMVCLHWTLDTGQPRTYFPHLPLQIPTAPRILTTQDAAGASRFRAHRATSQVVAASRSSIAPRGGFLCARKFQCPDFQDQSSFETAAWSTPQPVSMAGPMSCCKMAVLPC